MTHTYTRRDRERELIGRFLLQQTEAQTSVLVRVGKCLPTKSRVRGATTGYIIFAKRESTVVGTLRSAHSGGAHLPLTQRAINVLAWLCTILYSIPTASTGSLPSICLRKSLGVMSAMSHFNLLKTRSSQLCNVITKKLIKHRPLINSAGSVVLHWLSRNQPKIEQSRNRTSGLEKSVYLGGKPRFFPGKPSRNFSFCFVVGEETTTTTTTTRTMEEEGRPGKRRRWHEGRGHRLVWNVH